MRNVTFTAKSAGWDKEKEAINSAKGNAVYMASQNLKNNEVIIDINHINYFFEYSDGTGTCKSSFIIGTLDEKFKYIENEIKIRLEEAKLLAFKDELTLNEDNKKLLLVLTEKHGIEKMTNLITLFNGSTIEKKRKEI